MSFQKHWENLIDIEGDFVDDPDDSGGATRWGVTEGVARKHGYIGSIRDLPLETAMDIAKLEYWDVMQLDKVAALSDKIAGEIFDTGYNAGTSRAVRFLQRSLNALNRRQKDYDDQVVDGKIGKRSIAALKAFLEVRPRSGESILMKCLNGLQTAFYIELVERREKDERFLSGWIKNRID